MTGRFWSAECSLRIRRIIFRSMVRSALLTRWQTLLPSRADCKAFDKFTAWKGYKAAKEQAGKDRTEQERGIVEKELMNERVVKEMTEEREGGKKVSKGSNLDRYGEKDKRTQWKQRHR